MKLAEHNLQAVDGNEMEFRIEIAIKHPKYDKKTVDNDIALLKYVFFSISMLINVVVN